MGVPSNSLATPSINLAESSGAGRADQAAWGAALAVMLFASLFWVPRVIVDPLRHWDEAWYAQVSRELFRSDDPLTLTWNGDYFFHKPPLYFWATVACYRSIGVSEFSARLPSLVAGLATLGLVTIAVARHAGTGLGIVAGLLLFAIPDFSLYAIRGQMDVPMALFITSQLLTFLAGLERPRWHWGGGLILGLAILTKGAAAGVAILVQGAYMLIARDGRPLGQRSWWISIILGVALALPWHLEQWQQHGDLFARDYFNRHITQFFSDIYPETDSPTAPATYYLDYLMRKRGIWGIPLVLLAIVSTLLLFRKRSDPFYLLAWSWMIFPPAILSLAWAKWSWYLIPIYPAAAIVAALVLRDVRLLHRSQRWSLALAGLLALSSGLSLNLLPSWKEHEGEIRAIGPLIAQIVPAEARVLTLQTEISRRSIYPIAPCFYGERLVQPVMSLQDMSKRATEAGNALFALVHQSYLDELTESGRRSVNNTTAYHLEKVYAVGDVVLIRLLPGWLAEEIRQAALKIDESR